MSAIQKLLNGVVDYAGLFPPAKLPMNQVVENYATYLHSRESSMLGRLIIPAGKLGEFESAAQAFLPRDNDNETAPWRISALVPPIEENDDHSFASALQAIDEFNQRHSSEDDVPVVVDAIEVKSATAELVKATIERVPETGIHSFLEVPWDAAPDPLIKTIAESKSNKPIFAKIRTGAVTPDLIPPPQAVASFIAACARHHLGFKATAGLHHPMRAQQNLTYEDDSPIATLHGYLNVFIAAVFAFEKRAPENELIEILSNEDPTRFGFDESAIQWDSNSVSIDQISDARIRGIISFGSCSFAEPTLELQDIPGMSHQKIFSP